MKTKTFCLAMGITALLAIAGQPADAQSSYVEGVSAIINSGTNSTQIEVYSETFETADIAQYYEAYVEGYLYQNGSLITDGYALGSPYANDAYGYMTQPLHVPDTYEIQSDHYLVAYYTYYDASTGTTYYENPDYFANDGSYGGSNDFLPGSSSCGCYYETADYIYLGSTAVQMSSAPPAISSISPTGVSLGTSGTLTVRGTNLVDVFTQTTTVAISDSGITWSISSQSATQVTINYSVATSASTGNQTLTLSDRFGSSSATLNVGDATPQVTSISPATWNAGATTSVTFGGKNFGTAPTLSFSSSQVTASITSASNTQIVANVTVAAAAPDQTVTATVTSHGYNGSGFIQTNNNSSTGTDTATVNAIPAPAPKILRNGTSITGTSGIAVVTGQQIALTTQVTLPSGLAITSYSWSISGTNIGGYTPTSTSYASGNIVPTTVTQDHVTFYWVYAGQGLTAKYHYCMNNSQCSTDVQAAFNVTGVTSGGITTSLTSNHISVFTNCAGASVTYLVFGNYTGHVINSSGVCNLTGTPGIKFTAAGTAPGSGNFSWVQLVNSDYMWANTTTGTQSGYCGSGLDNIYPAYTGTATSDSPGVALSTTDIEVKRTFSAKMFLMWKSSTTNAVPVPIGYIQWQFSGDGVHSNTTSNSGWSLGSSNSWSANLFQAAAAGQNFHGYPTWNAYTVNGQCSSSLTMLITE